MKKTTIIIIFIGIFLWILNAFNPEYRNLLEVIIYLGYFPLVVLISILNTPSKKYKKRIYKN